MGRKKNVSAPLVLEAVSAPRKLVLKEVSYGPSRRVFKMKTFDLWFHDLMFLSKGRLNVETWEVAMYSSYMVMGGRKYVMEGRV
jgi:hypothetical protein